MAGLPFTIFNEVNAPTLPAPSTTTGVPQLAPATSVARTYFKSPLVLS